MLRVDISATLAKVLTPSLGIPDQELLAMRNSMKRYITEWKSERMQAQHAWSRDPRTDYAIRRVKETAQRLLQKEKIQTVLWVGIGGSGLGPRVMQEAFGAGADVTLHIVDTVDPAQIKRYLEDTDWKQTAVVVVSKSGETIETMSAFFLFWHALKKARGAKAADRVVAITDPLRGALHEFAERQDIEMLHIPPDVGGRFSIFTPVGLLPLALLKRDIDRFVRGATDMDDVCSNDLLEDNPAALLASVQFLLDTKKGCMLRVIMPYSLRLANIARWDQQLIAESLGKNDVSNPFPVAAIGTQDQHSLLQQWMQGPRKAWHLFIREIEKPQVMLPDQLEQGFEWLQGKDMGHILDAFYEGTSQGLTAAKRPHATISLTRLDEYHLGQLFYFFLVEVIFLGKLYRIDPYGQPGVELSKQIAHELLRQSGRR